MKQGFGTQQVEESLTTIFPQARIARLDSDVAKVRTKTATILKKFQELKYDILIGTQMVAKGHDFPAVTLVGIILADLGLSLPHYRASERTFQLISQAIGRTGRGQLDGEAMIQTYMPNHEAITTGARQDYARFFALEMKQRRTMQYPPYTYLVMIELSHKQQVFVDDLALQLLTTLQETLGSQATIIGPNIPYPELFLQWYRRRILIKYKDYEKIYQQLENVVTLFLMKQSIKVTINFDPYDL
jgi:primosomal protein N' (replication factor Y)